MSAAPETSDCRKDDLVPVKEHDYLDQDPELRGQRYACMSFVSPEDVLASKDAFVVGRFMRRVADDVGEMLSNIASKLPDDHGVQETVRLVKERHACLWSDPEMQAELTLFKGVHGAALDDEFHAANGFKTSVRGFKIRGVYDSVEDAKARAQAVKKFDDKFHVYIAQVGCWCPWAPLPDTIADVEYAETQLNTLVKKYHESQDATSEVYESRKADMMQRMKDERDAWVAARQKDLAQERGASGSAGGETSGVGQGAGEELQELRARLEEAHRENSALKDRIAALETALALGRSGVEEPTTSAAV